VVVADEAPDTAAPVIPGADPAPCWCNELDLVARLELEAPPNDELCKAFLLISKWCCISSNII